MVSRPQNPFKVSMNAALRSSGKISGRIRDGISSGYPHSCPSCGRSLGVTQRQRWHGRTGRVQGSRTISRRSSVLGSIRCMSSGSDFDGESDDNSKWASVLKDSVFLAVAYAGIPGTLAVVLGYLLKVDPFGNLHFSSTDTLIGLGCYLPSCMFQLGVLMSLLNGPKSSVLRLQDSGKMFVVAKVNEEGQEDRSPDGRRPIPESKFQLLQKSIESFSMKKAVAGGAHNVAASAPLLLVGVIFAAGLAQEMLQRGLVITWLSGWICDRYYESGAEDYFFNTGLSTFEVAKMSTLIWPISFALVRLSSRLEKVKGKQKMMKNLMDEHLQKMLPEDRIKIEQINKDALAKKVNGVIDVIAVANYLECLEELLCGVGSSAAFILTGNLLAAVLPATLYSASSLAAAITYLDFETKSSIGGSQVKNKGMTKAEFGDMRNKLLKEAVRRYLEKGDKPRSDGAGHESDQEQQAESSNESEEAPVAISVSGKILTMMMREEIAELNASIRKEKLGEGSELSYKLRSLEEKKVEMEGLLLDVETKLKETPENEIPVWGGSDKGGGKDNGKVKTEEDEISSKK